MSQRIDRLSEKPRFEETILRTEPISKLSKVLDKCKIAIEKKNITIITFTSEYKTLKCKVCWLLISVAIDNVKEK